MQVCHDILISVEATGIATIVSPKRLAGNGGASLFTSRWCKRIPAFGAVGLVSRTGRLSNSPTHAGLGSNGKEQRKRDGLYPARRYQSSELGWTFAGRARLQLCPSVVKPRATVTFTEHSGKTGYGAAVDNRQVPSPILPP
jgi:hypothetical protein